MQSWDTCSSIPRGREDRIPGDGCKGVADGNRYVYMTKGKRTLGFWRYDVVTDSWAQLGDVPPGSLRKKVTGGAGLAYVVHRDTGCVFLLKGGTSEFYRYNTVSGTWTGLPDAPTGADARYGKGSWLVDDGGSKLFLHKAKFHELYSFDIGTSTWDTTHHPGMPFIGFEGKSRKSKDGGCATREARSILAFKGGCNEFWEYNLDRGAWRQSETIPVLGSTGRKRKIKAGASLAAHNDTNAVYEMVFAMIGGKTRELWYFEIDQLGDMTDGPAASPIARGTRSGFLLKHDPVSSRLLCIDYRLDRPGRLTITVMDIAGRVLLTRETNAARDGSFCLDLRSIGPGAYLARMDAPGFTSTKKFVIVR